MGTPFLGMIQYFAFDYAPKGYALCSGTLMSITQNSALFSLLGVQYGGDGRTTFALPDLRGRGIMGYSPNNTIGEVMGAEGATLLTSNIPMHTHSATAQISIYVNNRDGGDSADPVGNYPATPAGNATQYASMADPDTYLGAPTVTVATAGSSLPFSTLNPYLALTCTIALTGIFPPRN